MTNIEVIFNDNQKLKINSYSYDKISDQLVIRIYNPESDDDIIDTILNSDYSKFDIIAEYPNKTKKLRFVNYYINLSISSLKLNGNVLEIYFRKQGG